MKFLAYSPAAQWQEAIRQQVPAQEMLVWLHEIEHLEASYDWASARVLILVAERWPDTRLEALLEGFLPRPVIVIDQTAAGHWHNREPNAAVHLVDMAELGDALAQLSTSIHEAPRSLGLFSSRNDADAGLLALMTAWTLHQHDNRRVLILDLALPQGDVMAYADLPVVNDFVDLVTGDLRADQLHSDRRNSTLLQGIDIVAMTDEARLSQLTAEAVGRTLALLKQDYDHLIINANGMGASGLLRLLAQHCQEHWLLADQKHISISAALELGEYLLQQGIRPGAVGLVLTPCYRDVLPDRDTVAHYSSIPVRGTLPWSPGFITAINAGTLLPPEGELALYLQGVEDMLGLRKTERWWQKLGKRSG